jgi:hypothetical protein
MTELNRRATSRARPAPAPVLAMPALTGLRALADGLVQVAYALAVGGAAGLLGGLVVGATTVRTDVRETAGVSAGGSLVVIAASVVLLALAHAASTLLLGVHLARVAAATPHDVPPEALRARVHQDDPVRPVAALCWLVVALTAVAGLVVAPALLSDDGTSAAGTRLLVVVVVTLALVGALLVALLRPGRRAWARLVASLDAVWSPGVVRAAGREARRPPDRIPGDAHRSADGSRSALRVLGLGAVGLAAALGPTALSLGRVADGTARDVVGVVLGLCVLLLAGGASALVVEAGTGRAEAGARGRS